MKRNQSTPTRRGERATPTRTWRVFEAMAYAGAFVDPTGILAVERLRRIGEGAE
jgi:hypothetical protein